MDAPLPLTIEKKSCNNKDSMINSIEQICKDILEKHLDGRKLDMDKIEKWSETIINEIEDILKKKYPEFGYGIFFYISDKTSYVHSSISISYLDTDIDLIQEFNTNDFYSHIRIFANKKYSPINNFSQNISAKDIMKINKILMNSLEGRTFIYDKCLKYIENIVLDINKILLPRKIRPCSYHVGFINELPIKNIYFTYKFINLEYMPLFFSYSNDSLSLSLNLFIVNN